MIQQRWSSHFNFIMVTAGAAVGLGPIWKFPYMAGANGGGAFVLVLVLAMFLIGVPILMGEMTLGRLGRANPVACMQKLAHENQQSRAWGWLGWWGALALLLVLAFYSVIAGWSIAYIFKIWTGQLKNLNPQQILQHWQNFLHSPLELLFWHSIFMALTLLVVARGIHKGLEQASRIMMPGLFLVLLILMLYSAFVGEFARTLDFLFTPDFSKLNPQVMINALGQAAFALAIGAGCMLTYGCYVPVKTKIGADSLLIAIMLIICSLVSGLAMFPLVFAYGLPPESGPSLMFTVLPIAFNEMPAGTLFGGLFFLMLWFAAWTSSISMAEPLVVILDEQAKLKRKTSSIIVGLLAWFIGIIVMLSFNILEDVRIFDRYDIFTAVADFATNIILPTGALGFAIFAGWIMDKKHMQTAMNLHNQLLFNLWLVLIRYFAPVAILAVMVC